jgi:hypothetical protein
MQQYISLLSTAQSQPTLSPSTRNQAIGFSFKDPSSDLWQTVKNKLHAFCKRKTPPSFTITYINVYRYILISMYRYTLYICNCKRREIFRRTKCMEFVFYSFCHRPDDGSLKLKLVAWLRVEGESVGCDLTVDKSEIYCCMYIPTGMSNIRIFLNLTSAKLKNIVT